MPYMYAALHVGTHAVLYVGTVPDTPNIINILTNIGHRCGHQSGYTRAQDRMRPASKTVLRSASM